MMGMSGKPPMKGSPMMSDDSGEDEEMGSDDGKSGKLLALQNLLGSIAEISDEELKPYIENMRNKVHMGHEEAEGDDMGMEQAEESDDSSMMGGEKPGLDVSIGMGKAPMSEEEPDEDEMQPKGGFLAILAKKMKSKSSQ